MGTSLLIKTKSLSNRFIEGFKKLRKKKPFIGKARQEKFDYLNSLQYQVLLKKKKDKFYLIISELSLVVVSDNLEKAYNDLHERKQNYFTKYLDSEAEDEIRFPRRTQERRETFHGLKLFIYKLLIIFFLGGVTFTIVSTLISNKIGEVTDISFFNISKKFVKETVIFINEAPEDIKQKRLERFRELVVGLKPLVQELETLFTIPDDQLRSKEKK